MKNICRIRLLYIMIIAISIALTSCAHVRVTQIHTHGGKIAYKGRTNSDTFKKKYTDAVLSICGTSGYSVVNQQQHMTTSQFTSIQTQSNTADVYGTYGQPIGSVKYQTNTPVTQTFNEYYWEDTIECLAH